MTIEVKELQFPPYEQFRKCLEVNVLDYRITFSVEVRKTDMGTVVGKPSFYINGIDQYRGIPFPLNENNYDVAKRVIAEHRIDRLKKLAGE